MAKLKVVGKPHPRLDGVETVSGRATYTIDVVPPGGTQPKPHPNVPGRP